MAQLFARLEDREPQSPSEDGTEHRHQASPRVGGNRSARGRVRECYKRAMK